MSNISKQFSGVTVLDNVKFTLEKGEVHVLIGENGAGKSTLMKILTGVYKNDSGLIELENSEGRLEAVSLKSPKQALDLGISMVFQEFNLMDNMTIAENIYVGREPVSGCIVNRGKMQSDAKKELEKVQLNIDPNRIVSSLTVAEKQCVEIAKCISYNAKVIVLDEPTSALSEKEVEALFRIVNNLKKQGVSIIYISHRMEEIFELGDRITVLRDGQYIDTVKVKETNIDKLVKLMIGREFKDQLIEYEPDKTRDVMLECKNIKVGKFDSTINFKAYKGEIVGVFGLIGAGRTELAKAIYGVDSIGDGEIRKNGKKINTARPWHSIKNGIGLIPEDRKIHGLNLKQNIRDNISMIKLSKLPFVIFSLTNEKRLADKYIKKLSIAAQGPMQNVERLSGGNQQKVVISKWLAVDMDVLIMDEPTRGIDVGAKSEIYSLMRKLSSEGKTIIMISSDLPEILRVSHRVIVMHDGKITFDEYNKNLSQEIIMHAALN
jgi:ribose transport system ATP-binding protein